MKLRFLAVAAMATIALSACSRPESARQVLIAQGYTSVETHGYSMFGCGKDDFYSTKFTAISQAGYSVEGVVCEGDFKGATVRIQRIR